MCVYIDDILITGTTKSEHLNNLVLVLQRLESAGMQKEKCANTACIIAEHFTMCVCLYTARRTVVSVFLDIRIWSAKLVWVTITLVIHCARTTTTADGCCLHWHGDL